MDLTKVQRRNLELYAHYRSTTPSVWRLFRLNLRRYLVFGALLILLYALGPVGGTDFLAWLASGMLLGLLLRDLATFRRFVHIWPALEAVLDWERVERLLSAPPAGREP